MLNRSLPFRGKVIIRTTYSFTRNEVGLSLPSASSSESSFTNSFRASASFSLSLSSSDCRENGSSLHHTHQVAPPRIVFVHLISLSSLYKLPIAPSSTSNSVFPNDFLAVSTFDSSNQIDSSRHARSSRATIVNYPSPHSTNHTSYCF